MRPIAIVGAAGFVGSRLIETCVLSGAGDIRPIVRNKYSLARLCRFGLDGKVRIADAENEVDLLEAIDGCPVVVNLVTGDPAGIIESTKVIYRACVKSGAKRLVHLSSAVVYGQVESPGVNDDSPLEENHWMPYARAKIAAENFLREVSGLSSLEVTILRPGIVWGPRSSWSLNAAVALMENSAYLVGDGSGVCNTNYIDNLISSILACCTHVPAMPGFYNIADEEAVTWREFYAALSEFLCFNMALIPTVASDRFQPTFETMLLELRSTAFYSKLKKSVALEHREMIKQWLAALGPPRAASASNWNKRQPKLFVSREMFSLQTTRYKLPTRKFAETFNFTPPVAFSDGIRMTINWLEFLGLGGGKRVRWR